MNPLVKGTMKQGLEKPLYRQIAQTLRKEIEEQYQSGDPIETEAALEQRFKVSRITVRRAIDELVHEGLLARKQGSGTFVAPFKVTQELGVVHSWTERMRELGFEPRTVDCQILQVVPPDWVVKALQLNPEEPEGVLRIQRLRYNNDEPLSLMVDHLRLRYVPDLAEKGLAGESLYETLEERYGLDMARVEDVVTARSASLFEASLLRIETGAPILCVHRITYLADDEPIDAATVVSRADRYEYCITGRPRARKTKAF